MLTPLVDARTSGFADAARLKGPQQNIGSIPHNFSWLLLGNVVYGICQWGILVVLAKFGSPEGVGQFALGLAVTAPIILFANMSLGGVLASDVAKDYSFRDYLGLRLITIAAALTVIGAVGLTTLPGTSTVAIVMTIGLMKGIDALSDIFFGLLQQREMMRRIGIGMICNGAVSLLAVLVVMALTGQVLLAAIGSTLGSATALLTVNIPSARLAVPRRVDRLPSFDLNRIVKLGTLAFPLGLVMLLISLNGNVPRYLLERYHGERSLGLYAALAYMTVAATTIVGSLGQAAVPQLARRFAAGDIPGYVRLVAKMLGLALAVGTGAVVVAWLAGRQLLTIVYRVEYATHPDVFVWITLAAAISILASVVGFATMATRRFQAQAPLAAVSLLATGTACVLLVPRFGILGAALGSSIGALVQLIGGLGILRSAIQKRRRRRNE